MHAYRYLVVALNGVDIIPNILFVESVEASVCQECGNVFPLLIQQVDREGHSGRNVHGRLRVFGEQHTDVLVLNIIIHGTDGVMNAGVQQIENPCFLFAYHHIMCGGRLQVAHVLHGHLQVIAGAFGLKRIVEDRFLSYFFQCTVYPLGAVGSRQRIGGERYLDQREPF